MTGHLLELLPAEADALAAAARILAERCMGPVSAVSLRASPGVCGLVAHMQSGRDTELREVEHDAADIAASVRVHNAERSAR